MGTKLVIVGSAVWMGVISNYGFPPEPLVWFLALALYGKAALVVATVVLIFGLFVYED